MDPRKLTETESALIKNFPDKFFGERCAVCGSILMAAEEGRVCSQRYN